MRCHWTGPLVAVLLASCASVPPHRGADDLDALLTERALPPLPATEADRATARADAKARLARPLSVDDAIAIALARSPEVGEQLAELGLEYAELLDASRIGNPRVELSALDPDEPGARTNVGISIVQGLADLLLLRHRSALARGEFSLAQGAAVRALQELVARVAEDYWTLVGAGQVARMRDVVASAARASAQFAEALHEAGNLPALELHVHQAEAVDAALAADAARADVVAARHALALRMGLGADEAFELAATLPLPVAEEDAGDALLDTAFATRIDLAGARRRTEALARALGVTRGFRWLGEVEVGWTRERETDGSHLRGPSVALELPIFHRNEAAVARAVARVELAEARALRMEHAVGHEVRAGVAAVAAARARAELHRDELVPLREKIVARTQEEVNFMLAGVFALIEAKHAEYDAYQGYLEALRDYWVARTKLALAVGRALPSDATIPDAGAAAPVPADDAPQSHEHHHDGSQP